MHFHFMQQNYSLFIPTVKGLQKKRGNVHLVIQSSFICKTLTKTNINKENHTLDLTKNMQYGLLD